VKLFAALHESAIGPQAKPADVRLHVGYWGRSGTVTSGTNPSLLTRLGHRQALFAVMHNAVLARDVVVGLAA
jgi:hypothetical protein